MIRRMIQNSSFSTTCKAMLAWVILGIGHNTAFAQSNYMEGRNNFAMYLKSKDIKELEAARKFADATYQTRRDSASFKNNLLRGLVYSTLAVVDSNRTQKYMNDPIDVAMEAMEKVYAAPQQTQYENGSEIHYIRRSLANAHLIKANRATQAGNAAEALAHYSMVDSIGGDAYKDIRHNLAVLSGKTGDTGEAIERYKNLLKNDPDASPVYVLELADLYKQEDNQQAALQTLISGRQQFPKDKNILFQLINTYVVHDKYDAIIPLMDEALAHESENVDLNFIAGYAHEKVGNAETAKRFYEKVITLDPNNFEGNYELGLLYLKEYVKEADNLEKQNKAQEYLLKANQIKPSEINTLRSLAVLYDTAGNIIQLERVNNILNQRIID